MEIKKTNQSRNRAIYTHKSHTNKWDGGEMMDVKW